MNQREKLLGAAVGLLVGYLAVEWAVVGMISEPLRQKRERAEVLVKQVEEEQKKTAGIVEARFYVNRWKATALPADLIQAKLEYDKFLHDLLIKAGITQRTVKQVASSGRQVGINRKPFHALRWNADATTSLKSLETFLYEFQKSGLMHQIRSMSITPKFEGDRVKDVFVKMTIEAISLPDAEAKGTLPQVAEAHRPKLGPLDQYTAFALKNVFQPTQIVSKSAPVIAQRRTTQPADERGSVRYAGAVSADGVAEAWLKNEKSGQVLKLPVGEKIEIPGLSGTIIDASNEFVVISIEGKLGAVDFSQYLSTWKPMEGDAEVEDE